jgi:23S rRNA G2445 N2-methylase RlmL
MGKYKWNWICIRRNKDNRYNYRKTDLPASINPTSAAIMIHEVSKYLNKDSKVLDPFCGTSTMLIERNYLSSCNLTGVDMDSRAIECSLINSKEAKVKVGLYNRNCLDHTGYYDEIISNMPYGNRVGTHVSNEVLYKDFINKLPSLLNDNGIAILLTSEIALMKKLLKNKAKLKLIKDIYTETGGLTPHLFVIKKA